MSDLILADYKGLKVQFTDDGWFNATAVAKRFGRVPAAWLRLPGTTEYLEALERKYGKFAHLKTKRGSSGGTWLHPRLAVAFARWVEADFAVWCDEQINEILHNRGSMLTSAAVELVNCHWEQRMVAERDEAKSVALGSLAGKVLRERRIAKPINQAKLDKLKADMQMTLLQIGEAV